MAMKTIAILSAAALLGACASSSSTVASLTPQQCDANWAAVGQADGLDGARAGKLLGYRTACARGGAPMSAEDEATWRDGWRKGVAALCAADEADLDVRQANARGNLCGVDLASVEDGVTLRDHDHNHGSALDVLPADMLIIQKEFRDSIISSLDSNLLFEGVTDSKRSRSDSNPGYSRSENCTPS